MTNYVTNADGSITFRRGDAPPLEVPGYVQDPHDRHHWFPDFEPCRYRERQCALKPCGALAVSWWCKLKAVTVNVPACEACHERSVLP